MPKVNRRKEIKEKEAFQLKFQLALSQNNKAVLNWLPKSGGAAAEAAPASDRQEFLDLAIVPAGGGLADIEQSEYTVGKFLQTDGAPSKKAPARGDPRGGSKAMTALMNKMRGESRQREPPKRAARMIDAVKKRAPAPVAPESDDEEETKTALMVRKQTKKLKGRPF